MYTRVDDANSPAFAAAARRLHGQRPFFLLVHGDGCGHCQVMRPDFDRVVQAIRTGGSGLDIVDIEVNAVSGAPAGNPLTAALQAQNRVGAVPFIAYTDARGVFHEFQEQRVAATMLAFIAAQMQRDRGAAAAQVSKPKSKPVSKPKPKPTPTPKPTLARKKKPTATAATAATAAKKKKKPVSGVSGRRPRSS